MIVEWLKIKIDSALPIICLAFGFFADWQNFGTSRKFGKVFYSSCG